MTCAAKIPYKDADLVPQPGAKLRNLTRYPVSGVVFKIAQQSPRILYAGKQYVLSCPTCAKKFQADPEHFVGQPAVGGTGGSHTLGDQEMSWIRITGTTLLMLGLAGVSLGDRGSVPGKNIKEVSVMEHLFDAELHHAGTVELSPDGPKEGSLIGGGEGRALGPRIKGKLRWSLYENSTEHGCTMQLPGEITTDDGATILFEGQGYAIIPDRGSPSRWKVGGAFRFQTGDARYRWLNALLALWDGDFDMSTGRARYRLYAPTGMSQASR